jgi:hypothetical protein
VAKKDHLSDEEFQNAYNSESAYISESSRRLSELCKFVWAGSLAIFYALITTDPAKAGHSFSNSQRTLLFVAATAGALAFLCDYLQQFCAFMHAQRLVAWLESAEQEVAVEEYNERTSSVFSKANGFFFYAKNLAALFAAALVAYVIAAGFLT